MVIIISNPYYSSGTDSEVRVEDEVFLASQPNFFRELQGDIFVKFPQNMQDQPSDGSREGGGGGGGGRGGYIFF